MDKGFDVLLDTIIWPGLKVVEGGNAVVERLENAVIQGINGLKIFPNLNIIKKLLHGAQDCAIKEGKNIPKKILRNVAGCFKGKLDILGNNIIGLLEEVKDLFSVVYGLFGLPTKNGNLFSKAADAMKILQKIPTTINSVLESFTNIISGATSIPADVPICLTETLTVKPALIITTSVMKILQCTLDKLA